MFTVNSICSVHVMFPGFVQLGGGILMKSIQVMIPGSGSGSSVTFQVKNGNCGIVGIQTDGSFSVSRGFERGSRELCFPAVENPRYGIPRDDLLLKEGIEGSDKCQKEKSKMITGDDLLWAMATLGFEGLLE